MVNDTTRLPGLDGVMGERVELDAAGAPCGGLSTGSEQAMLPGIRAAGDPSEAVDYDRSRDLPAAGRPVRLPWRKRRW